MESAKVLMSLWLILSLLDLNIIDIISVGNHYIMKTYSLLHNLGDINSKALALFKSNMLQ